MTELYWRLMNTSVRKDDITLGITTTTTTVLFLSNTDQTCILYTTADYIHGVQVSLAFIGFFAV